MNRTVVVVMVLTALALMSWQFKINNLSESTPASTDQVLNQLDEQAHENADDVELNEKQKADIAAYSEKMQSLTKVKPVPVAQVPNINQSLNLPELKSLTVNELTDPQLSLDNNEAIGSLGNAHAVSSSDQSAVINSSITPVIDTVSRQTGIPTQDIEAAFNQ